MSVEDEQQRYVRLLARYLGGALLLDPEDILGDTLNRKVTAARHLVFCKLASMGWDNVEIARVTGRDHSTVSVARPRMARRLRGGQEPDLERVYRGMPDPESRIVTEAEVVAALGELQSAMAAAKYWGERVEAYLKQSAIPQRRTA